LKRLKDKILQGYNTRLSALAAWSAFRQFVSRIHFVAVRQWTFPQTAKCP